MLTIAAFIVVIVLAGLCDRTVALFAHDSGSADFLRSHKLLRETLKAPGFYAYTVGFAIVVAMLHSQTWRAALFFLLATATSGLNQPIKWLVGRTRPYKIDATGLRLAPLELHPMHGGSNLCFPSGHATLAFATAAALSMLWPRRRWIFYLLASLVAAERFLENAHWLSDTVAGAALGIAGAHSVAWLINRWINRPALSRS